MNHVDRNSEASLCGADQEALDALIEAGLDLSRVSASLRARAGRVAELLSLAGGPAARGSDGLCDRVSSVIENAGRVAPVFATAPRIALAADWNEPELHPDDEEAIDAYVTAGFRPERVPASLRDRALVLDRIGLLLRAPGRELPDFERSRALVERTMASVQQAGVISPATGDSGGVRSGGFRMADLVSIAAAIVLGVAVLWPVFTTLRARSQRLACGSNMGMIATAFGSYAGDNREALPMASASLGGPTWWEVGTSPERSNSANLFQLPKQKYVRLTDMACAGNPNADRQYTCEGRSDWSCMKALSYSYQVMFAPKRPLWQVTPVRAGNTPMIILADRSPVVMRAREGQFFDPCENSPNHRGDGQWALCTDGSASWLTSPQRGEDNIWLPGFIDAALSRIREEVRRTGRTGYTGTFVLRGNESPVEGETFVGP